MRSSSLAGGRSVLAAATVAGLVFLTGCDAPLRMIVPEPPPPEPPPPEPPPPCSEFSLQVAFLGQGETAEIRRGELTLDVDHPHPRLVLYSPYTTQVPDGGANLDIPGLRPTVGVFVSNLAFAPTEAGFRQTMTLEWLSELEVGAFEPGCDPLRVSCDQAGCTGP